MNSEIEFPKSEGVSDSLKIDANTLAKLKNLDPLLALFVKSLLDKDLAEKAREAAAKKEESRDGGSGAPTSQPDSI